MAHRVSYVAREPSEDDVEMRLTSREMTNITESRGLISKRHVLLEEANVS